MGVVYRARDSQLEREVAQRSELARDDDEAGRLARPIERPVG